MLSEGYRPSARKTRAHEGEFYCPSVQILIFFSVLNAPYIRSPISTFMIEYGSSFYFLLCCSPRISVSFISEATGSPHEYQPSWARSNNLRCLLMINDSSRSIRRKILGLCHAIKGKQTSSNVPIFSLFFTGIPYHSMFSECWNFLSTRKNFNQFL